MPGIPPNVQPPSPAEIREKAAKHHIDLTEEEVADFQTAIAGTLEDYERLDEMVVPGRAIQYTDRDPGYRPGPAEDPLNAFVTKCEVPGADSGPLADFDVGLKDIVAVAGVEMTCGSKILEGYVPKTDATIVTRLLDAGATITGKLNMEDMGLSGSGELSATGPVTNPRNPDYLPGGSSSGSIAAVINGDVDVAIGGDHGGSIRIPAAWSGGVGHKPTYSLVPYTGIAGLGQSFDHTGPMGSSVEDCATVLDVIAGADPADPRQGAVPTQSYTDALDADPDDLEIGVLSEGFGHDQSEDGVDETVRSALERFGDMGANVTDVSIPMHLDGMPIWHGIAIEATTATIEADGIGHFANGWYDTTFMDAFGRSRRANADDYLTTLKMTLILGQYLADEYRSHYYAKAQNLSRILANEYDDALADVDVLAMPTTPQTAHERREELDRMAVIERALNMLPNTAPFNVTGHPALSVPCGTADDLPVGLMFVGNRFDDATVLKTGDAFERHIDWQSG